MNKVKYYTFKAGNTLPSWMIKITEKGRASKFKNKGSKVVFEVSCVVARYFGIGYKVMPLNNEHSERGIISICNVFNSNIDIKGGAFPPNGFYVSSIKLNG